MGHPTPAVDAVAVAAAIARRAHAGQWHRSGVPFIEHPESVADRVAALGAGTDAVAAAWLHDVLEHTSQRAADLRVAGVAEAVIAIVEAVSRRAGEPLAAYVDRIRAHPAAVVVKVADLADNESRAQAAALDAAVRAKYTATRALLLRPPAAAAGPAAPQPPR